MNDAFVQPDPSTGTAPGEFLAKQLLINSDETLVNNLFLLFIPPARSRREGVVFGAAFERRRGQS